MSTSTDPDTEYYKGKAIRAYHAAQHAASLEQQRLDQEIHDATIEANRRRALYVILIDLRNYVVERLREADVCWDHAVASREELTGEYGTEYDLLARVDAAIGGLK